MNVSGTFGQAQISMALEGFAMRAAKGQSAQTVELLQSMPGANGMPVGGPAPGSTVDTYA